MRNKYIIILLFLIFIMPTATAQMLSSEKDNIIINSNKYATCGIFSCYYDFEIKNIKALDKDFNITQIFDNEHATVTQIQVLVPKTEEYQVYMSNISCEQIYVEENNTYQDICIDNSYYETHVRDIKVWQNIETLDTKKKASKVSKFFKKYSIENFRVHFNVKPNSAGKYDIKLESEDFELTLDPWWNSTFLYKRPINITVATDITDYQMKINITNNTNFLSNWSDIRFVDSTETIELSYWIENKSDGNWVSVWIKGNFTNTTAPYVYYGNDGASDNSNITATMMFGDDFTTDQIAAKWDITGSGSNSITSDILNITAAGANVYYFLSKTAYEKPVIFESRNRIDQSANTYGDWGLRQSTSDINETVFRYSYATPNVMTYITYNNIGLTSDTSADDVNSIWHNYKMIWNTTLVEYFIDDVSTKNHTTHIPQPSLKSLLLDYKNEDSLYTDWTFIRKWTEIEPTYIIGAEEPSDSDAPTVEAYYQWNTTNDAVDFDIWTDGFVSFNWNLTDATGINTDTCQIQIRNVDNATNYTNLSYINDTIAPDYDVVTGYKNLTCYTEDLGGGVIKVSANMTRNYDWQPLNTAFDQDSAAHDNTYYSFGNRATKIVFHNITNTINTTFIFLADVDNQTDTIADHLFISCNLTYIDGDYTTDENCALVGASSIDATRDVNFGYIIGALTTDEDGKFGGVVHTETMYGISYCPSCTNTNNAWLTYSTNGYSGHSATSSNKGAHWTDLPNEEFNVILHVIDNTYIEVNLSIDDSHGNTLIDTRTDNYGVLGNRAPFGDIQTDNVTGGLISYYDIHNIAERGKVWINTTISDPNANDMNCTVYLLNNDSTVNQTLLSNYPIAGYGICPYEWDTTTFPNGDYRINVTAFDGSLTGYDTSTGYIKLNNTFPIYISMDVYDEITDNRILIDDKGYYVTVANTTNTEIWAKYTKFNNSYGGITNPTYACDKSKTTATTNIQNLQYVSCALSLALKNETIYYKVSTNVNNFKVQIYNFDTSTYDNIVDCDIATCESSVTIDNTDGKYTNTEFISYIRGKGSTGGAGQIYYMFNHDDLYDNITLDNIPTNEVTISVKDVYGDYAEHNYIADQSSNFSQDAYIVKLDDSITACFTAITVLGVTIPDVRFDFKRGGIIIDQKVSDDAGNVGPRLDPTYIYDIVMTHDTYGIITHSLIPTATCTPLSYSIDMNITYDSVMEDIYYNFTPYQFLWENENPNYAITIVSMDNNLVSFGANITYTNGTVINSTTGSASGGGTIHVSSDIGNYNGTLNFIIFFEKSGFSIYTISQEIQLQYFTLYNDTITGALSKLRDGTTGLSISDTEISIVFIIGGIILAIVTSELGLMATIILIMYIGLGVFLGVVSTTAFIVLSIVAYILSHNSET